MRKKQWIVLGLIFLAVIGLTTIFAYRGGRASSGHAAQQALFRSQEAAKYDLLAKRIFLEDPNNNRINFAPLREKLNKYFEDNNLSGGNLYLEYLPTGTSIRISGDEQLIAASLMKLPAAMDLYKANELKKINIDQKVNLKPEWLDNEYGTLYKKGAGYPISLRDAAKIMLEQSDNTALKAIGNTNVGTLSQQESSLNYLDLDMKVNMDGTIAINARGYSSILKCLYFACYNNKTDSQEILRALVNSTYNNRLRAGVNDSEIKIAHKIGTNYDKNQSDCGIVYVPKNNYVLCVMIPGEETAKSDQHIAEISKQVYEYIINNR